MACDKPQQVPETPSTPFTGVDANSTVLFQVYGSRDEPRAAPIAIIENGKLSPIELDVPGWHALDSLFFSAGKSLPIYREGDDVGTVEVVRGMWPANQPALYDLPGCREVVPQAVLRLRSGSPAEVSVEYLASSTPLKQRLDTRTLPMNAETQGRTLANAVATASEIGNEEIGHLEFVGRWLRTGAGPSGRTLLASYIDPEAGDAGPGAGYTVMVLVLAEDSAGTFTTSFKHISTGNARLVEFERLVNHADLDGDGVDEIILEAWRYATVPDLIVLKYADGKWNESFRVDLNWCVQRPERGNP